MALTTQQIENITADAVNLMASLKAAEVDTNTARTWVSSAMMAIVMAEADPPAPPRAEHFTPLVFGGKSNVIADRGLDADNTWPTPGQEEAKQAQLAAEQARWGDIKPTAAEFIHTWAATALAIGPADGEDMRLVRLDSQASGEDTRRQAMRLVRETIPRVGRIIQAQFAGKLSERFPVYLVTYQLAPPPELHDGPPHD
jgi:hypothetical protein